MMKRATILFFVFFSIFPLSFSQEVPKGEWDGSVDLGAGSNFATEMSSRKFSYSSADLSAWGRYRTEKFSIRLDLQCLSKFATTSITGSTVNINDLKAPQADFEVNHSESSVFDESAGVQMEFTPDERNSYSFNFRQRFGRQDPKRVIISMHNVFSKDDYSDVKTKTYIDAEEGCRKDMEYSAQLKWNHKFDKPGRSISSELRWALTEDDDYSPWYRMFAENAAEATMTDYALSADFASRTFRFTPFDTQNDFKASVLYRDVDLFGQKSLDLELGADFRMIYDADRLSAANYVQDVWVDSLKYRRNFDHLSMNLAPAAKLSYSPGKFKFSLMLVPDFYANRLDSDGNRGRFNFSKVCVLPDLSVTWTPSETHKTGVSYKQGVVRPAYLQICPFRRIGSNANEIQIGNPDLEPSGNGMASLFYTFHSGFFTGTLEGIGKLNWDRIEKAFSNEGEYRVYTWFNSGNSFDNGVKLTLKADLKNFNVEVGGYYNYFVGYNNDGDATRSSDWGVNGNAELRIKGGWIFNVQGRYRSEIIRTYTSMTEYVGCDVRITKNFKRFLLYLEGKDLFDRPIMTTTYSADKTYAHFEDKFYNRRTFSIGASFKF